MSFQKINDPILLDLPKIILAPRVEIRPPSVGSGIDTSESILETWEDLLLYAPWATDQSNHTVDREENKARRHYAQYIERKSFFLRVYHRTTGRYIGSAELFNPVWDKGQMEIGYWTRRSETGKGYTQESLNALIRFGQKYLNLQKIVADVNVTNLKSQHILEKLGFEKEGHLKHGYISKEGFFEDMVLYGLTDFSKVPDLDVTFLD